MSIAPTGFEDEYVIRFPKKGPFTISGESGIAKHDSVEGVLVRHILCSGYQHIDCDDGNICTKYYIMFGSAVKNTRIEWFASEKDHDFESQFPYFPFSPNDESTFKAINSLNLRVASLENMLNAINDKLNELLYGAQPQYDNNVFVYDQQRNREDNKESMAHNSPPPSWNAS
jgi:hypothetical protein